ncbi:hypothetical protein MNB_SV-6-1445 [hydrothermal vent metagenome]|uniref:Lipoprotein n=1 Tax=hydrothermal vent metagenome TaxID=652676 RepID=A0A1W1CGY5_9ZZZZ
MYRLSIISLVIILFMGCSSKHETKLDRDLEKSIVVDRNIQKTEKITIRDENETKILLTATYLNAESSLADDSNRVHEKFIIGIYRVDGIKDMDLISDEQNLTIRIAYPKPTKRDHFSRKELKKRAKGVVKLPVAVKKLSHNDPILRNMSLVNSWSSYYFVEFPHSINKKFTLTYQNKTYGYTIKKSTDGNSSKEKVIYTKYRLNFSKKGKYL